MEQSLNDTDYIVQRNEPYGPEDGVTHTIDWIGRGYDLPNVMIEIRNDLIAEQAGIAKIANWLTDRLLCFRIRNLIVGRGNPHDNNDAKLCALY